MASSYVGTRPRTGLTSLCDYAAPVIKPLRQGKIELAKEWKAEKRVVCFITNNAAKMDPPSLSGPYNEFDDLGCP